MPEPDYQAVELRIGRQKCVDLGLVVTISTRRIGIGQPELSFRLVHPAHFLDRDRETALGRQRFDQRLRIRADGIHVDGQIDVHGSILGERKGAVHQLLCGLRPSVVRNQRGRGSKHRRIKDLTAVEPPNVVDVLRRPIATFDRGRKVADRLGLAAEAETHHRVVAVGVHHHAVVTAPSGHP